MCKNVVSVPAYITHPREAPVLAKPTRVIDTYD
jgi:hypothetical protein